jgi:hypothetical protein
LSAAVSAGDSRVARGRGSRQWLLPKAGAIARAIFARKGTKDSGPYGLTSLKSRRIGRPVLRTPLVGKVTASDPDQVSPEQGNELTRRARPVKRHETAEVLSWLPA